MNQVDLDNECACTESALADARKMYSELWWATAGIGLLGAVAIWDHGFVDATSLVAEVAFTACVVLALVQRRRVSAALDLHYRATAALDRHVGAEREKLMGRVAGEFTRNGAWNSHPKDAA